MSTLPWIQARAFQDKTVLITGSGRGIGAAVAERFAQAGARVVVNDIEPERLNATERELRDKGLEVRACRADITRVEEAERLVAFCDDLYGGPDIFISSAGFSERRPLFEIDEPYWDRMLGVNLKGPFFCLREAARRMARRRQGRIILMTSIGAHAAQMHLAAYSAAKAGLVLLAKAAALELAPYGITVNAVGPGAVAGPWNDQFFQDAEYRRRWMATAPMRRMASNDDIAGALLFLASEDAGYITGQVLYVDGGKLAYVPSVDVLKDTWEDEADQAGDREQP